MKMRNSLRIFLYVLCMTWVVSVSGCTQGEERTATPQKTTLRIGYQPSTHQVAYMVAMDKGWWRESLGHLGIDQVQEFQFPSGPPEMTAMMAGELDVAYVGASPPLSAMYEGLDAKIVAAVQTQGSALVLQPEIDYKGAESIKGLRIGTFPPGSIQHTVLGKWLGSHAMSMEKDLQVVLMGPGDIMTAMKSKALDGAFLPHPGPAILEKEQAGVVVANSGEMWPHHSCCVLVLSGEFIKKYPDMAQAVVNTHLKATAYVNNNTKEAEKVFAKKMQLNLETVEYSFSTWDGTILSDPRVIQESVIGFAQTIFELDPKRYGTALTSEKIFDFSFYDKAIKE